MALTIDDIIAKFPNKHLPLIDGEPDYSSISTMVQLLYGNAATLPTAMGGGRNGHIGIIMPAPLYATLSNIPYVAPPDPGPIPIHANNANSATRETDRQNLKAAQKLYENHTNMNGAFKNTDHRRRRRHLFRRLTQSLYWIHGRHPQGPTRPSIGKIRSNHSLQHCKLSNQNGGTNGCHPANRYLFSNN
jgi:hypothetical protein